MLLAFLLSLAIDGDLQIENGRATIYYPGDGHCGKERADGKSFKKVDNHIAHRFLPLHTSGVLCNFRTRRCTRTTVRDRGNFGSLLPCNKAKKNSKRLRPHRWNGKTFHVKKIRWRGRCYWYQVQPGLLRKGWEYRGTFDLTIPVARAIGHRAFEQAIFIYTKRTKKLQRKLYTSL